MAEKVKITQEYNKREWNKIMKSKPEIITIEEATHDYQQAIKDYKKDKEVYKVQLAEILNLRLKKYDIDIYHDELEVTLSYTPCNDELIRIISELKNISGEIAINFLEKEGCVISAYYKI